MIAVVPNLSHDVMRFLWDGKLLANGVNPYLYTPSAPELDAFKSVSYFPDYEFKNTFTVYPPVAQLLFGITYFFSGDNPLGIRLAIIALDLLNIIILARILFDLKGGLSLSNLILYAWSPLLIIESVGNVHMEVLPTFFLLLSFTFLFKKKNRLSSLTYSLACWSKLYPALLLPFYLKYLKNSDRRSPKEFILIFIGSSSLLIMPIFITSGTNFLNQIFWYSNNITYNSSIFLLIKEALVSQYGASGVARIIVYAIFIIAIGTFLKLKKLQTPQDLADVTVWLFGIFFLFTTSIFQWYVLWLLPFLAIIGLNRNNVCWLYFSAAIILPYLPQFSINYESQIIALLEYIPLYALLIFVILSKTKYFSRTFQQVQRVLSI